MHLSRIKSTDFLLLSVICPLKIETTVLLLASAIDGLNLPKSFCSDAFARYSKTISSKVPTLLLSSPSESTTFRFHNFFDGNFHSNLFLPWEHRKLENSENAICKDFSEYLLSVLSTSTVWSSSAKISIDSLVFVEYCCITLSWVVFLTLQRW